MKFFKMLALSVMVLLIAKADLFSQVKGDELKALIKKQEYVFVAQNAITQRGNSIFLTSEYDVKVDKTSVECFLPFFGRAYTAPIDPTAGGIKFTSKKFNYKEKQNRKGGWDITISPSDYDGVNTLNLAVSTSGYTTLNVNSNQRSSISFYGYITHKPTEKETKD